MSDALVLVSGDDCHLEAEVERAAGRARATWVLCHPHPQYGGSMRSIVISALFGALPPCGVTTLRFNFRGVEGSGGDWDGGRGERRDVAAAVDTGAQLEPGRPLMLAGWSFGADMALSEHDRRVDAWFAIAPPLRYAELGDISVDPRPKLLALAEHDEVRDPAEVEAIARTWSATDVEVVRGASHFFVGRTDRLVELARGYLDRITTVA